MTRITKKKKSYETLGTKLEEVLTEGKGRSGLEKWKDWRAAGWLIRSGGKRSEIRKRGKLRTG